MKEEDRNAQSACSFSDRWADRSLASLGGTDARADDIRSEGNTQATSWSDHLQAGKLRQPRCQDPVIASALDAVSAARIGREWDRVQTSRSK